MGRYSLINVWARNNGRVSGNWVQDCIGTLNDAMKRARATEKANSNRIEIAIIEQTAEIMADYVSNVIEIKDEF